MRHDDAHVFPATYGGMPGYAHHPLAANIHPMAGDPWIRALAIAYFPDWVAKSSSVPKYVPSGYVRQVEVGNVEAVVELLSSADVSDKTQCFLCGGFGHPTTCELKDGEKVVCASKILGTHPKPDIIKSSNSDGRFNKYKSQMKAMASEIVTLTNELQELRRAMPDSSRSLMRKPFIPRAHSADEESAHEYSDATPHDTDCSQDHDSASDESDNSHSSVVQSMADAVVKGKRKTFVKRK